MPKDVLNEPSRPPIGWYEETMPVRGCKLALEDIKLVYRELSEINLNFGKQLIAQLPRDPNLSDADWEARKSELLSDAFRLTVTVNGGRDQRIYGETESIFDDPNIPKPIDSIYFTNKNSFSRNAGGELPRNRLEVLLDFRKPALLDPSPLVSEATPNNGNVTVDAADITYFRAVQTVIRNKLLAKKNWYSFIHMNFAYDFGLWFVAFPVIMFLSAYYSDIIMRERVDYDVFRWPLFIYISGVMLVVYRVLNSYFKWAFPVNILEENKDKSLKHRIFIGAIGTWLLYEVGNTIIKILLT